VGDGPLTLPAAMKRIEEKNFSTAWGGIAVFRWRTGDVGRRPAGGIAVDRSRGWMSEGRPTGWVRRSQGRIAPA